MWPRIRTKMQIPVPKRIQIKRVTAPVEIAKVKKNLTESGKKASSLLVHLQGGEGEGQSLVDLVEPPVGVP